jgi:hypothetical protein
MPHHSTSGPVPLSLGSLTTETPKVNARPGWESAAFPGSAHPRRPAVDILAALVCALLHLQNLSARPSEVGRVIGKGSPSRWAAAFRRGGSICLVPGPWRRGGPDVVAERSPRGLAGLGGDDWARPADQYVRGLEQGQPVDQRLHTAGTVRADPDAGLGLAGLVRGSVATRGPVHRRRALPRADDRQLGAFGQEGHWLIVQASPWESRWGTRRQFAGRLRRGFRGRG